jgi:hypothetical protein
VCGCYSRQFPGGVFSLDSFDPGKTDMQYFWTVSRASLLRLSEEQVNNPRYGTLAERDYVLRFLQSLPGV